MKIKENAGSVQLVKEEPTALKRKSPANKNKTVIEDPVQPELDLASPYMDAERSARLGERFSELSFVDSNLPGNSPWT